MIKSFRPLKSGILKLLFKVARSQLGAIFIGWSFTKMSAIIPVTKLYETQHIVAFHHPEPTHKTHVLIVPKRSLRSIASLSEDDHEILGDIVRAVRAAVRELDLEQKEYRLCVNGGAYQDIKQVHFHLTSD